MASSTPHWVESLFPAQYSIRDYRETFKPDHQRLRRYITTLSSFDGPTLSAIYEQSYLFTLIQRLAQQEEENQSKSKIKTKGNQTESPESILDIRLIRAYLEKHKEQPDQHQQTLEQTDHLWSSDELSIIRTAYMKVRDDCLRLKSENDYYREQLSTMQTKLQQTTETLEKVQEEHFSLQKIHTRWTLRTNSSEQLLDEQRRENGELLEHVKKLTEQNEIYRREHLQMQGNLLEKQTHFEHLQRKLDGYDRTIKNEYDRRMDLVEKRAQVEKDRHHIQQNQLQNKLDEEQNLRRQNLLALDQLRKHIALPNPEQSLCDIKHVKYV